MKSITEAPITSESRVFVATELNVPIVNGEPQEIFRLERILPTLKYITDRGGHVIIGGHVGSPDGQFDSELSTEQLRPFFEQHLPKDSFTLLENLRFDPREKENDLEYSQELAQMANMYVNENFSTSHRKHASLVGITQFLPSYAGLNVMEEIESLNRVIKTPKRPLVAIIGGAKIESKAAVIDKMAKIADKVLLAGKIGLQYEGEAANVMTPVDYAQDQLDIGPDTIKLFAYELSKAATIVWAGPAGMFEEAPYDTGTRELATAVAKATKNGAFSVVGGGDTIAAINKVSNMNNFSFISTGGGAMLTFLVDETLPALQALNTAENN